ADDLARVRRQKAERASLEGPHSAEVAFVKRQDAARPKLARKDDDREIGEPDVQIGVSPIQLQHRFVVATVEAGALVATRGKVLQEGAPRRRAEAPTEQVIDLGGHRRRDEEAPMLRAKDLEDLVAPRLAPVGKGDERRRVDDEGHLPKPARSSSSGISETGRGSSSIRAEAGAGAEPPSSRARPARPTQGGRR